jgi:hypothetical protein
VKLVGRAKWDERDERGARGRDAHETGWVVWVVWSAVAHDSIGLGFGSRQEIPSKR